MRAQLLEDVRARVRPDPLGYQRVRLQAAEVIEILLAQRTQAKARREQREQRALHHYANSRLLGHMRASAQRVHAGARA
jgi:hypothetical protein